MANMEVGGRVFRDIESYKAARRDFDSIEDIKERHDLTRIEDVERIRDNIINGNYRFETMLGDDFLDELDELLETLKKDKALSQNERKGFKLFNKEEKTKGVKEQIREKLVEILVSDFELKESDIKDESNLFTDLDFDSIDAVDLAVRLQQFTDKKISPEEFREIRTISDVVNAIYDLL